MGPVLQRRRRTHSDLSSTSRAAPPVLVTPAMRTESSVRWRAITDYVQHYDNPTDPRLGRHVRHDPRSWNFAFGAVADTSRLASVRHESQIPTLDQGQLGSCTGNAATKCLSYEPFWSAPEVQ